MSIWSRNRVVIPCGTVIAALFLMTACDPPGKPTLKEEQEESGAPSYDFAHLYSQNCSGCHGADGKYGAARILNDRLYLAFISRDQMRSVLNNGRQGMAMPAWSHQGGGPLDEKQIDILVNGIFDTWGKGSANIQPKPPSYEQPADAGDPVHGKRLFAKDCYMCHGPGARVGAVTDPAYLALVSNQYIRTSIVVGRSDLGMPNYRYLNLGKPLSDGDVTDLVAYLVSKRGPQLTPRQESDQGQGTLTKGNEGSGNGPGSPQQRESEGNKGKGSNSQQGVK